MAFDEDWRFTEVTGATGDIVVSAQAAYVRAIRIGGTAVNTSAVVLKNGTTAVETLAASSAVGTQRDLFGVRFSGGIKVNLGTSGDKALVFWQPA